MKIVVWMLVLLLLLLHQDYWQWNDGTIVLGFLPKTLAYHMFITAAAAVVWWLAVKFSWPLEHRSLEHQSLEQGSPQGLGSGAGSHHADAASQNPVKPQAESDS